MWNDADLIFYSSSNPTNHFQLDKYPAKTFIRVYQCSYTLEQKMLFTQAVTQKYFEILFYILEIRLLVLKQAWVELSEAKR